MINFTVERIVDIINNISTNAENSAAFVAVRNAERTDGKNTLEAVTAYLDMLFRNGAYFDPDKALELAKQKSKLI